MDKEYYKELSAGAADGDAKAFSKLYEMIYREMYYTAFYTLSCEKDATDAVINTARDGFNAISRLRTEESFEVFMMKTLCSRIKTYCKDYGDNVIIGDDQPAVKKLFFRLSHIERLIAVLYVAARLEPPVIAAYMGMTKGAVSRRLTKALTVLEG